MIERVRDAEEEDRAVRLLQGEEVRFLHDREVPPWPDHQLPPLLLPELPQPPQHADGQAGHHPERPRS